MLSYHTAGENATQVLPSAYDVSRPMNKTTSQRNTSTTQVELPRVYLAVITMIAVAASAGVVFVEDPGFDLTGIGWTLTLLSILPLIVAQLALGHPTTWAWLRARTGGMLRVEQRWMLLPIACYVVGGLAAREFDPYATAVFVAFVLITIGTLAQADRGYPRMMWTDTTFWFFLWIPFDYRWTHDLWYGPDELAYAWWAVTLTVVVVYGYGVLRDLPGLSYRLVPRRSDIGIALAATAGFGAVAIPIGLYIDFLNFPPTTAPRLTLIILELIGVFLTVAIPEELFFRGILQYGLTKHLRDPRLGLLLASLAFGLMHWNNAGTLAERLAYVGLATVAGLFYGWAYKRSEGLLAPILCHTLVDVIWRFGFQ